MKLIRCYVSSFGKLKNYSYDFNDKLNTIKQDNGWGKSTLATFIKAMFYGLNSSKRNVADNERTKYRTWNSTQMFGGFVEFEWGGKQFKLERYFGTKEAEDTVRLFDGATGKEYTNTDNLGKRIFEVDEEGFLSTTYFSQKDFQAKSNTSLTAKFNSVCEIQNTESFDKAIEKLEDKSKKYKQRGDKGIIADTKREINLVEQKIDSALSSKGIVKTLKSEIEILTQKTQQLNKISLELTDKINNAGKIEVLSVKLNQKEKLLEQRERAKALLDNSDMVLCGKNPNPQELSTLKDCVNDLSGINYSIKQAKTEKERLELEKQSQTKVNAKINSNVIILSLCAVFAILSIVGFCLNFTILGAISVAVSVILLAVFFFVKSSNNKYNNNLYDLMIDKQVQIIENSVKQRDMHVNSINSYLSNYNFDKSLDVNQAIKVIEDALFDKKVAIEKLKELDEQLKEYLSIDGSGLKMQQKFDVASLRSQLNDVQNAYQQNAITLANKRASLKTHEEMESVISDLENKKAQLTEDLERYVSEYKTITLAVEFLKTADENLKIKYRLPLQNSLNKYLNLIDSGKSSANIDIDLNVTVNEPSGQMNTEYYSKGYQNLFEICKRFALTDVLFTGEKPFIILDDPFYNLDDEKLKNALELVKKLSEEYQIIYLICHESRVA